jgi:hypothetical protein
VGVSLREACHVVFFACLLCSFLFCFVLFLMRAMIITIFTLPSFGTEKPLLVVPIFRIMMPFQCFPNSGKFLAAIQELCATISEPLSPELKAEANETRMSWISRQLQEDKNASTLGGEPLSGLWPMAIGSIHGATISSVHCSYV